MHVARTCAAAALPLLLALGCGRPVAPPATPVPTATPEPVAVAEPVVAPEPEPVVVVLAAVGDVLPHRRVKATAAALGWAEVFGDAVPLLQAADIAFANLESPIAPDHHQRIYDEVFDAPADLAPALAAAGIDLVSTANNHAYDQGPDGLVETWTRVREAGVAVAGTGPTCAEAQAPRVVEVRGVRVGFLAFTDLANFDRNAGPDAPCLSVTGPLCTADCGPDRDAVPFSHDTDRLKAAIASVDADFVVVSLHWGFEHSVDPLPDDPALARALIDAGADVVLGHHPHVLQPVEVHAAPDGRTGVIAYSLGNFVSNMAEQWKPGDDPAKARTRDGLLLQVPLEWRGPGDTRVGTPVAVPLWTENQPDRITVRTLEALAPELAAARRTETRRIVGPSVPDAAAARP